MDKFDEDLLSLYINGTYTSRSIHNDDYQTAN